MSAAKGGGKRSRQSLIQTANEDTSSREDAVTRLLQLAALDDLLAFQTYAKTIHKYEKKREDRTAEWTTFPRRSPNLDLKGVLGSQDLATLPISRLKNVIKDALPEWVAQQREAGVKLVQVWHGFQQTSYFSLHVQGSTTAGAPSNRATTTIKQRRKVPGLNTKSWLDSLMIQVGQRATAQELVDAGVPSRILIANENSGDWRLALGPGSHIKRACGSCFYVCSQQVTGKSYASISQTLSQEDQAAGKDLFFYGGPVWVDRCANPQHAEFSRMYETVCSDHTSLVSYDWVEPSGGLRAMNPKIATNDSDAVAATVPAAAAISGTPFDLSLDAQLPLAGNRVPRSEGGSDARFRVEVMGEATGSRSPGRRSRTASTDILIRDDGRGSSLSQSQATAVAAKTIGPVSTTASAAKRTPSPPTGTTNLPSSVSLASTSIIANRPGRIAQHASRAEMRTPSPTTADFLTSHDDASHVAASASTDGGAGNGAPPSRYADVDMQDGGEDDVVNGDVYEDGSSEYNGTVGQTGGCWHGGDDRLRPDRRQSLRRQTPLSDVCEASESKHVEGNLNGSAVSVNPSASAMPDGHQALTTNVRASAPNGLKRKRESSGHSTISDIILGGNVLSPPTPTRRCTPNLHTSARQNGFTGKGTSQRAFGELPTPGSRATPDAEIRKMASSRSTESPHPRISKPDTVAIAAAAAADTAAAAAADQKIKQLETMLRDVQKQLASTQTAERNSRERLDDQAKEIRRLQDENVKAEEHWSNDRRQLEAEVSSSRSAAAKAKAGRKTELEGVQQELASRRQALDDAEKAAAAQRERQELSYELDRASIAAARQQLAAEREELLAKQDAHLVQSQDSERTLKLRADALSEQEAQLAAERERQEDTLAAKRKEVDDEAKAWRLESERLSGLRRTLESDRVEFDRQSSKTRLEHEKEKAEIFSSSAELEALRKKVHEEAEAHEKEHAALVSRAAELEVLGKKVDEEAKASRLESERLNGLRQTLKSDRLEFDRQSSKTRLEHEKERTTLSSRLAELEALDTEIKSRSQAQEAQQAKHDEAVAKAAKDQRLREAALRAREEQLAKDREKAEKTRTLLSDTQHALDLGTRVVEAEKERQAVEEQRQSVQQRQIDQAATQNKDDRLQIAAQKQELETDRATFNRKCQDANADIVAQRNAMKADQEKLEKERSELRSQAAQVMATRAAIQALNDEPEPPPESSQIISQALSVAQKELAKAVTALEAHVQSSSPLALQSMLCCGLVAGLQKRLETRLRGLDAQEDEIERRHKADIEALRDEITDKDRLHQEEVTALNAKIAEHSLEMMAVIASLTPADSAIRDNRTAAVNRMYRQIANVEPELLRAVNQVFDGEDLRSWRRGNSTASLQVQERVAERISTSLRGLTERMKEAVAMFGAEVSEEYQADTVASPSMAIGSSRSGFMSRARTKRL